MKHRAPLIPRPRRGERKPHSCSRVNTPPAVVLSFTFNTDGGREDLFVCFFCPWIPFKAASWVQGPGSRRSGSGPSVGLGQGLAAQGGLAARGPGQDSQL